MSKRTKELSEVSVQTGKENFNPALFDFYGKPPAKEYIPLGAQHVVVAIVNAIVPALIIAHIVGMSASDTTMLVQVCLICTGLASLTQIYSIGGKIGARLPVFMGTSFAYVPTNAAIAGMFGMPALLGSQVAGGIVTILFGMFLKPMRKLFPPIVTGTVIFTIGISLYTTGVRNMAGGAQDPNLGSVVNWVVAVITLVSVIYFTHFTKGLTKLASVLMGVVVGYIVSIPLGLVSFDAVREASFTPTFPMPFHFGIEFVPAALVSMAIMSAVNCVQTIGDVSGIAYAGMDRQATGQELSGGIITQGVYSIAGAVFGPLPLASYSQNVGLITFNKVVSRPVFTFAAVVMLVAGIFPAISATLATIPQSVLGGATIIAFATITINGLKMIYAAKLTPRNMTIMGLSVAIGIGIVQVPGALAGFPQWVTTVFATNAVVGAALLSVLLNVVLPRGPEDQDDQETRM
jgi:NCS2 family nucleobase:cation symporter-2